MQVSSIWVFLQGRGQVDTMVGMLANKPVRTTACALNRLDRCPYHRGLRCLHVRRSRDPFLLVQYKLL